MEDSITESRKKESRQNSSGLVQSVEMSEAAATAASAGCSQRQASACGESELGRVWRLSVTASQL